MGAPPVLAAGVGGGRGVCHAAATRWGARGAPLHNQAAGGRGEAPGGRAGSSVPKPWGARPACATTSTAWACSTWPRSHPTPRAGGPGLPRRSRLGRARDANRHGPGAWRATPSPTPSHRWPLRGRRPAGGVGRSRRAARGPWWPALRHCGASPGARAGPALRSGWSCGAPACPASGKPPCAMPQRIPRWPRWCG